jgi:hypothetical protein
MHTEQPEPASEYEVPKTPLRAWFIVAVLLLGSFVLIFGVLFKVAWDGIGV